MSKTPGKLVPPGLYRQSRFFATSAGTWKRLGNIETRVLADTIADIQIEKPVYVCSLARAGTTIVTEMLEKHPDLTSHRYSDFPNVWTPYWRNYLLNKSRRGNAVKEERFHKDRIQVSNDSPEAVEEVLWSYFFPGWIHSRKNQVLDGSQRNPDFDRFYHDHLRKLLAIRGKQRYLAKGNYNLSRLKYILTLYPDAKFLIPLRDPLRHIASLAKQHALFLKACEEDPRVARQLDMAGHHEFGPGRRFVNYGNQDAASEIDACWLEGRETEGWAIYWAQTFGHLGQQLSESSELRKATLLFSYEDLCEDSLKLIDAVLTHCELDAEGFAKARDKYGQHLTQPDYYQPGFDAKDIETIWSHCEPVVAGLKDFIYRPV